MHVLVCKGHIHCQLNRKQFITTTLFKEYSISLNMLIKHPSQQNVLGEGE